MFLTSDRTIITNIVRRGSQTLGEQAAQSSEQEGGKDVYLVVRSKGKAQLGWISSRRYRLCSWEAHPWDFSASFRSESRDGSLLQPPEK